MENVIPAKAMALFASIGSTKRRTHIVAVDLGMRTTKAVALQRKADGYELTAYTIQDALVHEKAPSPQLLAEHLTKVMESVGARTKQVTLVIGVNDSLL